MPSRDRGCGDQAGFTQLGQAVAIPFGANTALYFLRDLGKIRAGQDLLIIGASGAIGSAAVQLAKYFGATVTGVLVAGTWSW